VLEHGLDGWPALPPGSVGLLFYGLNDLAVLGARLRPYREAMRTMISRYRAGAVFALGGRDRVTLELPESFAGGTVAVGFEVEPWAEARASVSTGDELELAGSELCFEGRRNALVSRLDVPAATRRIDVALEPAHAGASISYWELDADPPPPVGVVTQFPLANYDLWSGWPAHPLSHEDVTEALNPTTRDVVEEFDQAVGLIEIEDAFPGGYRVAWDCYPDDEGYARLADAVLPQLAGLVGRG
jgi:hypothetical protein